MYLTIAEACKVLRTSRWTIRRLLDSGKLEAIKVGRRVRITRASVERYIAQQTVSAGVGQ